MDMNDRQLRFIVDGLGGKVNGTPREDGFDITVASEVMAIFCLATSISDLKERLSKIVCAYTYEGKPVTAGDIGAAGAMTALLKDALDPNLVQTLENNPAIIHGGPFANIAHGCNSVMATKLSLSLADYVITEAGFGADPVSYTHLDVYKRQEAARKSDFERSELNKEKTGVKLEGVMGINPVNDKQIPIFISDYVLSTYGTGAIMAVPAHDTRDWEFAKKFGLPIIEVVKGSTPSNLDEAAFTDVATGTLVNSGFLDGLRCV